MPKFCLFWINVDHAVEILTHSASGHLQDKHTAAQGLAFESTRQRQQLGPNQQLGSGAQLQATAVATSAPSFVHEPDDLASGHSKAALGRSAELPNQAQQFRTGAAATGLPPRKHLCDSAFPIGFVWSSCVLSVITITFLC